MPTSNSTRTFRRSPADWFAAVVLLVSGVLDGWFLLGVMQATGAASEPTAKMFATLLLVLWTIPTIAAGAGLALGRKAALKWGFMSGVLAFLVGVVVARNLWHLVPVAVGLYCAWRRGSLAVAS